MSFSKEDLEEWFIHKDINPKTRKKIKIDGPVYKTLQKAYDHYKSSESGQSSFQRIIENDEQKKELNERENLFLWNEKDNLVFSHSLNHMENMYNLLQNSTIDEKELCFYIEHIKQSYEKPFPFTQSLEELVSMIEIDTSRTTYKKISESSIARDLSLFNCHDGQRKLTLDFLQFIEKSLSELKCSSKDVIIIYAGFSSIASSVAAELYPDLLMVLYDPDVNATCFLPKQSKDKTVVYDENYKININSIKWSTQMIFTKRAGWFSDNTVLYLKNELIPRSGRKYVLFVSDIRSETSENNITEDMRKQMRWTMMLKAKMYMHKFRLPYLDESNIHNIKNIYEDIEHLYPYLKPKYMIFDKKEDKKEKSKNPNNILYLDGEMFIQPFAPQRTTELRLIGKPHSSNGYQMRYYNVYDIENQMAIFNTFYRNYALFIHPEINYESSFEKILEFDIISKIAKSVKIDNIENIYKKIDEIITDVFKEKSSVDHNKYRSLLKALRKTVFEENLKRTDEEQKQLRESREEIDKKVEILFRKTTPPYFMDIFQIEKKEVHL